MCANVSSVEVNKFNDDLVNWWHLTGPMKVLHHINPARIDYLKQHIELENKTVLDVGCGGGIFAEALSKNKAQVTAIDANPSAIQVARHHAKSQGLTINYQHTLIEDFQSPEDGGYDIVTCLELLEHVPNPAQLIKNCFKQLSPGGLLLVSTINRTLMAYAQVILAAEYLLGMIPKKTHNYAQFIRPSELDAMIHELGGQTRDLTGLVYNPFAKQAYRSRQVSVNYFLIAQRGSS